MEKKDKQDHYKELSALHGWPDSKYLPLILKKMVTPEQAEIMLQLPSSTEKLAEIFGMESEKLEQNLQELFEKGIVFSSKKGWRTGRQVDSLHDLTLSNKKYWNSYGGREIADLWNAFERLEWWPVFVENFRNLKSSLFRVLPAWETVVENPKFLPIEDVREIYREAESIVAIPCPCRQESYDTKGRFPDEVCIALNRSAEYNLRRGVGRKLTLDEALDLEQEARKNDLVTHVPNNAETTMVICHCHPSSCLLFKAFEQYAAKHEASAKSRYTACVAEPEKCTSCQKCLETCHFGAIEMKKYPGIKKWKADVNPEICIGCGNCVIKCPKEGALILKLVRPPEHIPSGDLDIYAYEEKKK